MKIARGGWVAACILAGLVPHLSFANEDLLAQGKIIANRVTSGQLKASDLTAQQHHAMRAYAMHLLGKKPTTTKGTAPPGMTAETITATCRLASPDADKSALICADPALDRVQRNCSGIINEDGIRTFGCGAPAMHKIISSCVVAPATPDRLLCE